MATITDLIGSTPVTTAGAAVIINANFDNLNTDKIETSVISTDTTLGGASPSDAKLPSEKAVKAYADSFLSPVNTIYPVGSIYLSTVSTNPNILFGLGTWVAWGAGRVPVGVGSATKVATFASRSSNVITVTGLSNTADNEFQTGQAVLYTAASGAMTGLTHNTVYYVIMVTNSTFSLATTLALAQAGTVISLSSDGTGTQTFTKTLTTRAYGDTGGEETHAMSSTELLVHTHGITSGDGTTGSNVESQGDSEGTVNTGSAGGNVAMNNMQPFITCYIWNRTA